MPNIAVIGVGDMGTAMLPHLVSDGFDVVVYDTDAGRLDSAVTAGARAASTPADAARGAAVVLTLVMAEQIPDAHFGAVGALAGLSQDAILVIGSTMTPADARSIAEHAGPGMHLVDAPIVGGVRFAQERRVTFLAGGAQGDLDAADAVLSRLGAVERVGPYGSGAMYKLITNAFVMAAEVGLREALDLTDMLGGDYETALRLFGVGPMAAVVTRALDSSNPRPLRASAEDFDTLLGAVDDPEQLPISAAARTRLWQAVTADPAFEPMFIDLTRKTTALAPFRAAAR